MTQRRPSPPSPEPPKDGLRGIGNFTGWHKSEFGRFQFARPVGEPLDNQGRPALPLAGMFVQTACKLFNRDGHWPGWFLWVVTDEVPHRYRQEAARLAAVEAKRGRQDDGGGDARPMGPQRQRCP